jgi:hypothetical protein
MKVDEILTFDDYWKDPRFARKVPTDQGAVKRAHGDNIYRHSDDGTWVQADLRHSLADGKPNPWHIKVDTSIDAVLVARRFSYFGGAGPTLPTSLRGDFGMDLVQSEPGASMPLPIGVGRCGHCMVRNTRYGGARSPGRLGEAPQ